MIYPDVPPEQWAKKHKVTYPAQLTCPKCQRTQELVLPFITKEYVGLQAQLHECGPQYQAALVFPRSEHERAKIRSWYFALVGA